MITIEEFQSIYETSGEVAATLCIHDLADSGQSYYDFVRDYPELAHKWPIDGVGLMGLEYCMELFGASKFLSLIEIDKLSAHSLCHIVELHPRMIRWVKRSDWRSYEWYIVLYRHPALIEQYYHEIFDVITISGWQSLCREHETLKAWLDLDYLTYEDWDNFMLHDRTLVHPRVLDDFDNMHRSPEMAAINIEQRARKRWGYVKPVRERHGSSPVSRS